MRCTAKELEESMDWAFKLKLASYCYNTTVHNSTGYSPFYLMFGRHPRLITSVEQPIDLLNDSYLVKFNNNLKDVWQKAQQNIIKAKEVAAKREEDSVARRTFTEFKVGDWVKVRTEVFLGRTNRTVSPWMGPYEVLEVRDTNLMIKKLRKTPVINKGDCQLFIPGSP